MARPYHLQAENCLYHITSRGDDRKKIFLSETDFEKFLEYINGYAGFILGNAKFIKDKLSQRQKDVESSENYLT
jgi:REP element-mobilizing transposase RayT